LSYTVQAYGCAKITVTTAAADDELMIVFQKDAFNVAVVLIPVPLTV